MLKKSFSNDIDDTFESGILTLDSNDFLKVSAIEVWGLPEHNTFKILKEYHQRVNKQKKNNAMRNKKALFNNDFNKVKFIFFKKKGNDVWQHYKVQKGCRIRYGF